MNPRIVSLFLFLAALLTARPSAGQPRSVGPQSPPPQTNNTAKAARTIVEAPWTGDLDGMIKRRVIRVLVTYNKTGYFIDKGVQRGLTYDAFRLFEDQLNAKLKTGHLRVHVVFIPVGRNELEDRLLKGRGDIVAANIAITDARDKIVDFSEPALEDVKEVIVTGPGAPAITKLDDLAGLTVHVRSPSLYQQHLAALSDTLVKSGKKPIAVKPLPSNLEDEDVLEMANAGLVKITVVDDHLAAFWQQIFTGLTVHGDVAVASDKEVGVAFRENSPQLKAALDAFMKANRRGTTMGNVLFTKYLKNTKFAKSATSPEELKKFQDVINMFRKYSDQYGMDYLLMAAQGYQESGLNQSAKSKVGAVGVMQVMPSTGKDMNVGDIRQIEPNINAGVKYIRFMVDQYFKDEPMDALNKELFAFAAYNAGPARVKQLRAEAAKDGLNPNLWFNNVERVAARRIGRETVQYVSNIYKYYIAYQLVIQQLSERRQSQSPK